MLGSHQEHLVAVVTELHNGYDLNLGIPWLMKHQPCVGWNTRELIIMCAGKQHVVNGSTLRLKDVRVVKPAINMVTQ